jgi:AraC-like DNA-binding protein
MRIATFAPTPALAPFVSDFALIEARRETTRVLVSDASITLGFRYQGSASLLSADSVAPSSVTPSSIAPSSVAPGSVSPSGASRLPDVSFTGMRTAARHMRTSAGGGIVVARFREAGARAFFDLPLHELFGATVSLLDLAPRDEVERTAELVTSARDAAARVRGVERFLLRRLRSDRPDPLVAQALLAIRSDPASVRVGALARELGVSRDRLEKRFRASVGSSPKQLASILRLYQAVRSYRTGANLSELSARAGYFDQSHFNREFRAAIGQSPQQFFASGAYC